MPIRRRYARLGRTRNKEMDVLAAIPEDRPEPRSSSLIGASDDSSIEISSGVASRLNGGPRNWKATPGQVGSIIGLCSTDVFYWWDKSRGADTDVLLVGGNWE